MTIERVGLTFTTIPGKRVDKISVTREYDLESIDPWTVIEELRDYADSEERSYSNYLFKTEGVFPGVVMNNKEHMRILGNNVN